MIAESGPISAETPLADAEKRNLDWSATLGIGDHPSLSALRAIGDTEMMSSRLPGGRGERGASTAADLRPLTRNASAHLPIAHWRCTD